MARNLIILSGVLSALIALEGAVKVNGAVLKSNLKSEFKRVRRTLYKSIHDYIDDSVDPCDDFYQHACGNWEKLNPIPDDVVDYKPIKALSYHTDLIVNEILASEVQNSGNDSAEAKAKIFYASCVDHVERDKLGVKPMVEFLETLGGWPVLTSDWSGADFDWLKTIAILRRYGDRILIKESVNYNKKNSSLSIIYIDQSHLGLGNRADYLDSNYEFRLVAYKTYIVEVLEIFGVDKDKALSVADEIIAFETELARILAPASERSNISTFSDDIQVDDLQLKVPGINWTLYLSLIFERPIPSSQPVVIKEFQYMNDLAQLISQTDRRIVANYIFWRFAQFKVIRLSSKFEEPLQRCIYVLLGRKINPPTWKMCANDATYHLREAVGSMFIQNHFEERDRQEVIEMVVNLKQAFTEIIFNSSWLDADTKELAKKKLDYMVYQVGYPEFVSSQGKVNALYANVTIVPDRYFDNYLALLQHTSRRKHAKVFQIGEDEWSGVSPDLTNAYHNPVKNKVTIPAGLLQQPLFDKFYTKSFNYGRMGALIGHEMAHAFDNIGRNYDYNGNINTWWDQKLIDIFNEKSECFLKQYSQYRIPDGKHMLDSKGTLSENLADNGGVLAAFRAYKNLMRDESGLAYDVSESEVLPDDAIFFYSFAQLWCGYTRPEALLTQTRRDPHSPAMWRVIGSLSNSEDFARVFNCSQDSIMNPIKKCRIW